MKQLLIVTDSEYANFDDNGLKNGSIVFTKPSFNNDDDIFETKITENFSIMLGRGNKSCFVIPEVDINSLQKSFTNRATGSSNDPQKVNFEASVYFPEITPGNTYGIRIIKLGTNVGERNTWTATYDVPLNSTMSKADLRAELIKQFYGLVEYVEVENNGDDIIIRGIDYTMWDVQLLDSMRQGSVGITQAENTVIDKAYLTNLASQCAAGKGYNYTDCGGTCLYSPEDIPDGDYCLFTLRFQVGRNAGKTRDEKVWQTVHIAVQNPPLAATIKSMLDVKGNFPDPE